MSVIPIEMVRGNHLVSHASTSPQPDQIQDYPVTLSIQEYQSVSWVLRAGRPALKTVNLNNQSHYLAPESLAILPDLTSAEIETVAKTAYQGEGNVIGVSLLDTLPLEVDHLPGPLYRVRFDDWINTSFYVHPQSGVIRSVRSDLWRLFDFFWMLHIMDYEEREDFNNWLLITTAIASLLFTFSGFCMLYFSVVKPRLQKVGYRLRSSESLK